MRRNNRNTLLLIAGVTQIVKSFAYCVLMLMTSLFFDVIDLTIRRMIYLTTTYAIKPEMGEKLITLITVGIFLYLGVAIVLNFASGILFLEESKRGNEQLRFRSGIIALSTVSVLTLNACVPCILAIIALIVDKSQPEDEVVKKFDNIELQGKVNEIQKLKDEKKITKQEYIDLLTKVLTE